LRNRGDGPASDRDRRGRRPSAHAVLRLNQAGWYTTQKRVVPDTITLLPVPLPTRSSELNPVKNL
jgi:hypothetical protein